MEPLSEGERNTYEYRTLVQTRSSQKAENGRAESQSLWGRVSLYLSHGLSSTSSCGFHPSGDRAE